LRGTRENGKFTSGFGDRTICAKKLSRHTQNRNFTSVFGDRTSFRAKWLRPTHQNRIFLAIEHLVSCERVAFRAVSLALPRALREKKEKDKGKRARGQERMDVKM